jgi:8-oxo-dGTP diphosphatase
MGAIAKGAKALIIKDDAFLVLIKTNGHNDLPGGKSNFGESFKGCLEREIDEETALKVKIQHPVAYWSFYKKPSLFIRGVTYICRYTSGNIKLSEEHKYFKWVEIKNIRTIKFRPSYGTENLNDSILQRQIAVIAPVSAPN